MSKLRAKRETVHRDRLTRSNMRKLNPEHPNNPAITTYTSHFNSPESIPTTQLSSPPEQTTRVTLVNSLPATTPIAPNNTYRRGRQKGSKSN
jgi:hypothetical protein